MYRRKKNCTNLCPNSSSKTHLYRCRKSFTNVYLCRIDEERYISTGAERAVQMCISVEFIKKDTFVQTQKELYKCVSLSNSSRKTHLYRRRKSCTNVYICRIHQERHICTGAERAVQMCISVEFIKKDTFVQAQKQLCKCVSLSNSSRKTNLYRRRKSCRNLCPNSSRKTHLYRRRKSCTNVFLCRIHQEKQICTDADRGLQMCISVEFMKKDTIAQRQKDLYKCVSLSNSSRKTHLYMCRKSCTNVYLCPNSSRKTHWYRRRKSGTNLYLCRIHQERHICKSTERAVQICISVEFIKKDTFVQAQKELYKCVPLSNLSGKTHLYRRGKSCTNVYFCRIHQ